MNTQKIFNLVMALVFAFSLLGMPVTASAQEPVPHFAVHPEEDAIPGWWGWPSGTPIAYSVDDPVTPNDPDYSGTTTVTERGPGDSSFVVYIGEFIDIKPGFEVIVSDGVNTKSTTVTNLQITMANPYTDTISGTADPGSIVVSQACKLSGCKWDGTDVTRTVIADSSGNWVADYSIVGASGEPVFNILPGANIWHTQVDEDGDSTRIQGWVPNPTFAAHFRVSGGNQVHAYNWRASSILTLTIDDPNILGSPDFTASKIVPNNDLYGNTWTAFELPGFELKPGQSMTITDGITTKTHVVMTVAVTSVNPDTDIVSGTAEPNTPVGINAHYEPGGDFVQRQVVADVDGNWTVDLSIPGTNPGEDRTYNIVPGSWGTATQWDEDGDNTYFEWRVPYPPLFMLNVLNDSSWDGLDAWNWPLGSEVTLTVDNPNTTQNPDYTEVQTMAPGRGSHETQGMYLQNNEFDGRPGFIITLSDGIQTKSMTVPVLQGTEYDLEADTISGLTDPFASVVVACEEGVEPTIIADSGGHWVANFRDPENPNIVIYDVKPGSWCEPQMYDADRDHIVLRDWRVPNPRFSVWLNQNKVDGYDWPQYAPVTLTVEDSSTTKSPDFTWTRNTGPTDWDDSGTAVSFQLQDRFQLKSGQIITLTSGSYTKTHTITNLVVTSISAETDTVTGTAAADSQVRIENKWNNGMWRNETAAPNGSWTADFNTIGDETGENIGDILPGDEFHVGQNDEDSDGTWWYVYVPNPNLRARLSLNRIEVGDWPAGTLLTLTIDDPATGQAPDYTATLTAELSDPNNPFSDTYASFEFGGVYTLKSGDLVNVSGGGITREMVVANIHVTSVNVDTDIISGTAGPGISEVSVRLWSSPMEMRRTSPVISGAWTADFSVATSEFEAYDIKPGDNGVARWWDENGNMTSDYWNLPNPSLGVRANDDKVEGWQWPLGATITVTVDDPGTQANPDITRTAKVNEVSGKPGEYRFDLNLNGVIDIKPGFEVKAGDDNVTKTLIVTSLAFTDINVDTNTVTGVAAPNSNVDIWTCDNTRCYNIPTVTANDSGAWVANFTGVYDIGLGTWIDSSQTDDDGDQTMYGKNVPNPRIDVSYEHDWIQINDFTPGGQVTYTIYDHQGGHALFGPVTGPVDSHGNGWISNNLFHTDLIPGNYITALDVATGRESSVLIQNVNLDYIGIEDDRVFGTAEPNATLQLNISETNDQGFNLPVTVDASGNWEVDLAAKGYPIDSYRYADARLYDAEGNSIIAQSPWIDAEISTDNFWVTNFSKNADVTFSLYDSPGGTLLYGPVTRRTDGSGSAGLNLWDQGIDLVPGNYIVAHDHQLNFTKSLEIEPFDFVDMNAADDTVSGMAAPGESVDLHVESMFSNWGLNALTNGNGDWSRDYGSENYDITDQMWANGWAVDDRGNRSHDHITGLPSLEASLVDDWISGYNFSPDRQVRVRIYASEAGNMLRALSATPLADILVTARGDTSLYIDYWQHGVDIQPGMYILAEDLETGKSSELTLAHLTFDGVDYDTDTAWGTANPGAQVVVRANHLFDNYEISTIANADGNWSVDFSSRGADINSEWDLRSMIFDEDRDATIANAPRPPKFTASLNGKWINGNDWTRNNQVTINIYEYKDGPAVFGPFTSDTDNHGNFNVNLWNESVNLIPGNYITVTDNYSNVMKTLLLPNLTIDYLDPDQDVAGGQAPADTRLSVNFNNQQEGVQFDLFSESDGTWEANFAAYDFDLQPGSSGSVSMLDQDGDTSQVDGRVLTPYIEASPNSNWIHAREWPIGTVITMTISGSNETYTATMAQAPWNPGDPNDIVADFDLRGYDVKAGDVITATGNSTTKTLTVSQLEVTDFDLQNDLVSGKGTPGVEIQVCANLPNKCITRWVTPNAFGNWTVNYHVPGTGNDDPATFDVKRGSNGWAAEYEADSDRTWYDWNVPNPNFGARPTEERVEGWQWPLNAIVTIAINDPATEINPDFTGQATVGIAPWDSNQTWFDLNFNSQYDLKPGDSVTVTYEDIVKTHTVTNLQITNINPDTDIVSGTTDTPGAVDLWICDQNGCVNRNEPVVNGNWSVNFHIPGNENWEKGTYDIQPGTGGDSAQWDEDGDGTMMGWQLSDQTPPTITWIGNINDNDNFYFNFVPPAPTCTATDDMSGLDGACTVTGYASTIGTHTLTATAKDKAGNIATETRTYTVSAWTLKGFYQPVDMNGVYNIAKNGSTIPFKFEIFAGSTELTNTAYIKSLTSAETTCNANAVTDEIELTATGGTSLRYDATSGQFIYNWKTPKTAGKCYRVTMTTIDGSTLMAYFKLK